MPRRRREPKAPKTKHRYGFRTPRGKQLKQEAFLKAYAQCGMVYKAAQAVGIERHMHSRWLADDPEYSKAFDAAQEQAAVMLQDEAVRRAVEGLVRFKFHNGEPLIDPRTGNQYCEIEYSDTLLIFLLKGALPEKYRDRREISGPAGGPIEIKQADELTDEQLARIVAQAIDVSPPPDAIANDAT